MDAFVGDILAIRLRTSIDLSGLDLYIKYKKPDGTAGYWTAGIDPSDDTILKYITEESDLSANGAWKIQAYAESDDFRGHGTIVNFNVGDPLVDL